MGASVSNVGVILGNRLAGIQRNEKNPGPWDGKQGLEIFSALQVRNFDAITLQLAQVSRNTCKRCYLSLRIGPANANTSLGGGNATWIQVRCPLDQGLEEGRSYFRAPAECLLLYEGKARRMRALANEIPLIGDATARVRWVLLCRCYFHAKLGWS